jgi:nucleoside-diphosphate-sugar epimerase
MKEVVDKPFKVEYIPARKVDVPANVLDIERAKKYLGFEPQTNLKEGIAKAWKWVKSLNLESANQRV